MVSARLSCTKGLWEDEDVIEQFLINLVTMIVGVSIDTYLGAKIMKHELRREITRYIVNDLPHVFESEQFRSKMRGLVRSTIREFYVIIAEELGVKGGDKK